MIRSARALLAGLTGGVLALTLAAAPAQAARGRQARPAAASQQPTVAITGVSPQWAGPHTKVTVSGVVTNPSAAPVSGLTVQLMSSGVALTTSGAMMSYLAAPPVSEYPVGTRVWSQPFPLGGHSSQSWSLTLPASLVGTSFGAYPLTAQLSGPTGPLAEDSTFLPIWPGKSTAKVYKRLRIAWIWPLIGTPDRTACPGLLSNGLAADVSGGGRLGRLLAEGRTRQAQQADLTWAIDPGLLAGVSVMTRRYLVGGTAACSGATAEQASAAAKSWLAGIQQVARTQDYFVTPYDDVDVAALAHRGLTAELGSAITEGRQAAQQVLHVPAQRPTVTTLGCAPPQNGATGWIAWPPNGIADATVLAALAGQPGCVGTVVLDSTLMPPVSPEAFTPGALTSTSDGMGSQVHVLLADNMITEHILGGPDSAVPGLAGSPPAGSPAAASAAAKAASFARSQWFLAETAMIASQVPHRRRSLVIAPPRRWNPAASLAGALLEETVTAPWLHPSSLASVVAAGPGPTPVRRQDLPQKKHSKVELKASVLRRVRHLATLAQMQGSIFTPPKQNYLSSAVAAAESSAWRGGRAGRRRADALLQRDSTYVTAQLRQVGIVQTLRVTLGGKSGEVPVSIINHLRRPVTVRLDVHTSPGDRQARLTIGRFNHTVTVGARQQRTVKIPVRAAQAGSTTLSLQLSTPQGRLLPEKPTVVTVDATHFGTLALVIIGIALLVFVLTAGARAMRRGGGRARKDPEDAAEGEDEGVPSPAYASGGGDTVEPGRAEDAHAMKEPDDQATTQGQAGQAGHR